MVRDIYNIVRRYQSRLKMLERDDSINPANRQVFLAWLKIKEDELIRRKGGDEVARIRFCKTLFKYITLLRNTDTLFKHKDLSTITSQDIKTLYLDLEEGRIKMAKSTRRDYYNKIFKSDFFHFIGKRDLAKEIITKETDGEEEVKFFELQDLLAMGKRVKTTRNKLLLYLLFDSGVRIGTALNLFAKDCEKRHNIETKTDYYVIHIRKEYTKSKHTRHIPLLMNETNELLAIYLQEIEKDALLFDFSYQNANKLIKRAASKAKVRTKPDGRPVSGHDFRKSCATHLLAKGYSLDFVKSRLGHKPSSQAIDRYVSYLGLDEVQAVTEAQTMDYNALKASYQESIERLKVLDANLKQTQKTQAEVIARLDQRTTEEKLTKELLGRTEDKRLVFALKEMMYDILKKDPALIGKVKKMLASE